MQPKLLSYQSPEVEVLYYESASLICTSDPEYYDTPNLILGDEFEQLF